MCFYKVIPTTFLSHCLISMVLMFLSDPNKSSKDYCLARCVCVCAFSCNSYLELNALISENIFHMKFVPILEEIVLLFVLCAW